MILFLTACTYNILVDMATTYWTSEEIVIQLGFRTYFGEKIKEVDTFSERFETYGMQRILAENLFKYSFPSTYLIPFIIEPIATIYAPLMFGMAVVATHPEIDVTTAEKILAAIPMDLGRYA